MTKMLKSIAICAGLLVMCLFLAVGYAAVTDTLSIGGSANAKPSLPDVYITNVTPNSDGGVTVYNTQGTALFARVNGSGSATFSVDFVNISDKIYVFERVIDGAEIGIDGVYSGDDIKYEISGIKFLDEISPDGGTRSLTVTITVPKNVTAENYILKFNFVEKTGTEILPGNDEYDVTFKYNNGQPDTTTKLHANEFVPRPEVPIREGYTFAGWYTDIMYTSAWNFDVDRVFANMTLYAKWEWDAPTSHKVTFIPNNGDSNYMVEVLAGSLIPLPNNPSKEGYSFIGWYTDSACTRPWNFDTDKVDSNIVLYGGWEIYVPPVPPDCNITFKPNNGESDTTIIVLTGEFIPRPIAPTKDGYSFIGWYIDEACTMAWNFEVNRVTGHTVLYGGWELKTVVEEIKHTITFKPGNGDADTVTEVIDRELIPRPLLPVRDGYSFIGWYTDADLTSGWNFDTDVATSDMTLYGGWEKYEAPSQGDNNHSDFLGLVEALLSNSNNCLNDNDLVFDAVMESLTSKKGAYYVRERTRLYKV